MTYLRRTFARQRAATVLLMLTLCAGGSLVAAAGVSASTDLPLQPQCGPDPVTLIDPCQIQSAPGVSGPSPDAATAIPWDVVDSVLFG